MKNLSAFILFTLMVVSVPSQIFAGTSRLEQPEDMIDRLRLKGKDLPSRSKSIDDFFKAFKNVMKATCESSTSNCHAEIAERCSVRHTQHHMKILLEDFYISGLIRYDAYQGFKNQFTRLRMDSDATKSEKDRWLASYNKFADEQKDVFKRSELRCVNPGQVSNIALCCGGIQTNPNAVIFSLPNPTYEKRNPACGKKKGEECSAHTECCSGECSGLGNENGKGRCESVKTCFQLLELGGECGENNPYCGRGKCQSINWDAGGMATCSSRGVSCSSNVDCCSDSCVSGKCQDKLICTRCTDLMDKPTTDKPCCSGSYHDRDEDICAPARPIFVLPDNIGASLEGLYNKILNFILPSAYAQDEDGEDEEFRLGTTVDSSTSVGSTGGDDADKGLISSSLTDQQEEELRKEATRCSSLAASEKEDCINGLNNMRRDFMAQNEDENGGAPNTEFKTRKEWANQYNIPGITASEKSNFETCQINSFLDQWLDTGPTERNAEVVMRGFEVALSGQVTLDKQIFRGKSLNENLVGFMKRVREERIKLTDGLKQMDQAMFCKCVLSRALTESVSQTPKVLTLTATDFPEGTPAAKVSEANANRLAMWNNECSSEKEEYAAMFTEAQDGGSGINPDFVSSGQPARRFLAEWSAARGLHQADRFDSHIALEIELNELITELKEVNWEQNEPITEADFKNDMVRKYGDTHNHGYLYELKVYWWTDLAIALAVFSEFITGGLLLTLMAIGAMSSAVGMDVMGLAALSTIFWANGDAYPPRHTDIFIEGSHTDDAFKVTERYNRYVEYDYYDNNRTASIAINDPRHCRVHGYRYNCVKNFYKPVMDPAITQDGNARFEEYRDWFSNYENYMLIDLWLPAFYEAGTNNFIEDMKYVETVNEGLDRGLLIFSAPDIDRNFSIDVRDAGTNSWQEKMGEVRYKKMLQLFEGSSLALPARGSAPRDEVHVSFLDSNILEERFMQYFIIDLTKMVSGTSSGGHESLYNSDGTTVRDKFVFTAAKIAAYKNAVKKYASCDKLIDCGYAATSEDADKLIGFKGYFQTEDDLDSFANYVYQMHFIWPKLSGHERIGYPMIGMTAYLEGVLLNLKVLGSLNSARGLKYADLSKAYHDAFIQAGSWFDAGIETTVGNASRNVELLDARRKQFETVLLAAQGPGAFKASTAGKINTNAKGSSLQGANLSGLPGNVQKFVKTLQADRKKKEAYDKYFGNTARGKAIGERANNFMKQFSSPLSTAKNAAMAASSTSDQKDNKEIADNSYSPMSSPNYGSGYVASVPSGHSNYNSNSGKTNSNTPQHGLRDTQIEKMLSSAKDDDNLRMVNDNDTIFHIVSKAYKRNLDRVLTTRASTIAEANKKKVKVEPALESAKKQELKNLLGN